MVDRARCSVARRPAPRKAVTAERVATVPVTAPTWVAPAAPAGLPVAEPPRRTAPLALTARPSASAVHSWAANSCCSMDCGPRSGEGARLEKPCPAGTCEPTSVGSQWHLLAGVLPHAGTPLDDPGL